MTVQVQMVVHGCLYVKVTCTHYYIVLSSSQTVYQLAKSSVAKTLNSSVQLRYIRTSSRYFKGSVYVYKFIWQCILKVPGKLVEQI